MFYPDPPQQAGCVFYPDHEQAEQAINGCDRQNTRLGKLLS
ncbi:MAG: hypothetical protein ACPGWR_01385 [Ardenticatenaceae bacterium]